MKYAISALLLASCGVMSCGGPPFTLADNSSTENIDAAPQEVTTATDSQAPLGVSNVRDLPDAPGLGGDSGSLRAVAENDAGSEAAISNAVADAAAIADAGTEAQTEAKSGTGSVEAGIDSQAPQVDAACAAPPVAPDGYSNICATSPTRGSTIIETFPGECACNWTCACLMTSSVCQGLGTPSSCQVVNGATCNSVVVAVVVCK